MELRPRVKMWLETKDGLYVIGKGTASLLSAVKRHGSIKAAALECGMSYNYAWHLIRRMECNLQCQMVERRRGGKSGGSSRLTEEGESVLNMYLEIEARIKKALKKWEM